MFTEELAGFHRKPGHKNGKEAIFEALCRVPAFASIAGVAAPSTALREHLRLRSGDNHSGNAFRALPIGGRLCLFSRLFLFAQTLF